MSGQALFQRQGNLGEPLRILVACVHYSVSSGRFITRALKRLGHDVMTVGPAPGRMIWGIEVEKRWEWMPDLAVGGEAHSYTAAEAVEILWQSRRWRPELIVTADSAWTLAGDLADCPHVLWGQDNHVRDYQLRRWDAMFLAHSWGARIGEPNAFWLPPCYDGSICRDLELPVRDLDVVLVGYPYDSRVEILEGLRAAGLNVLGSIGALMDVYNALYNRGKIALVKSSCGDLGNRFFENMAQGCCVLADRVGDAEKLGFVAGVDYWPYDTPAEAVREAQMLLETGRWRDVAAAGKRKVLAGGHRWDDRALRMLETLYAPEIVEPGQTVSVT